MKELLVVVDMQNDFVFGALGTREARAVLPAVKKKAEEARGAGKRVVFTRDTHGEDYLSTQEGKRLPVLHCLRKTRGWEIVVGLYFKEKRYLISLLSEVFPSRNLLRRRAMKEWRLSASVRIFV